MLAPARADAGRANAAFESYELGDVIATTSRIALDERHVPDSNARAAAAAPSAPIRTALLNQLDYVDGAALAADGSACALVFISQRREIVLVAFNSASLDLAVDVPGIATETCVLARLPSPLEMLPGGMLTLKVAGPLVFVTLEDGRVCVVHVHARRVCYCDRVCGEGAAVAVYSALACGSRAYCAFVCKRQSGKRPVVPLTDAVRTTHMVHTYAYDVVVLAVNLFTGEPDAGRSRCVPSVCTVMHGREEPYALWLAECHQRAGGASYPALFIVAEDVHKDVYGPASPSKPNQHRHGAHALREAAASAGDDNGNDVDEDLVRLARERLRAFTSDKVEDAMLPAAVPGFEREDCAADIPVHEPSDLVISCHAPSSPSDAFHWAQVWAQPLPSAHVLSVCEASNAVIMRADVDGALFRVNVPPREPAGMVHDVTLPALAYMSESRRARKFVTCSRDSRFAIIGECTRFVSVYDCFHARSSKRALHQMLEVDGDVCGFYVFERGIAVLSSQQVVVARFLDRPARRQATPPP